MKKSLFILPLAAALGFSSCDLDSMSLTEKDVTNFPANADDAAQVLAAIYQNNNRLNATPQSTFHYYSLLASDDMYGGGGNNDRLMQSLDLICISGPNETHEFYKARYEGINRANTLLSNLDALDMPEDVKNQTKGEALFLRAYYYYELASMYGRVFMVTEPTVPANLTQPTHAEIWGQICQDLYTAATIMPSARKTDGHVDKYAAEGMLARAYLFYTGFFCNGETIADLTSANYSRLKSMTLADGTTLDDAKVIELLKDCVENSGYSLVPKFANLWPYANRCTVSDAIAGNANPVWYSKAGINLEDLEWVEDDAKVNPEAMFTCEFNKLASWSTTIGYGNGFALHFGVRDDAGDYTKYFPFGQGWGAGPVATNFSNEFALSGDPRFKLSLVNIADLPSLAGQTSGDYIQETDFYQAKIGPVYAVNEKGALNPYSEAMYGANGWINDNLMQTGNVQDQVFLRFADVLLMLTELTEEVQYANQVQERAGATPMSSYSLEKLQEIRRFELCFEGPRWNDIRRWHIAAAALDKQQGQDIKNLTALTKNTPQVGGYKARYNATAGFQAFPENEVTLSAGALEQNAGWLNGEGDYNGWN